MAIVKAALFSFIVAVVVVGSDAGVTVDEYSTSLQAPAGKIVVYKEEQGEASGVTLTYDAIKEVDQSGNEISGHSFDSTYFSQVNFTLSSTSVSNYPGSRVMAGFMWSALRITIGTNNVTLGSEVYVFMADGVIQIDGKDFEVTKGMMKFNIIVESWPFCDNCMVGETAMNGAYLDVTMEVKSKQAPKMSTKADTYDLGGGDVMSTPKLMYIDDSSTATTMMTGYPAMNTQGTKNTFTFRFPKFINKVVYDPTVSLGDGNDPNSATGNVASVLALAFCAILKYIL